MSLEDILNAKLEDWSKTDKGRKAIGKAIKGSVGVAGRPATDTMMMKYAQRMKDILREEIAEIKSKSTGDSYLDHIDINNSVSIIISEGKECLCVGISFDHSLMHRDSLFPSGYPDGIDVAYLVNNGYSASNHVYGTDRHGNNIASTLSREENNYIQRAVSRFNAEMSKKGVVAEFNANYTGGTFGEREY